MLSDVGIQQAFIQNPRGDERAFLNTAWTIRAARGVVLWLIAMLIAYPMALVYGQSELFGLLCVGCLPSLVLALKQHDVPLLADLAQLHFAVNQAALFVPKLISFKSSRRRRRRQRVCEGATHAQHR